MVFAMIYFFYWATSLCNVNEKQVVSNSIRIGLINC